MSWLSDAFDSSTFNTIFPFVNPQKSLESWKKLVLGNGSTSSPGGASVGGSITDSYTPLNKPIMPDFQPLSPLNPTPMDPLLSTKGILDQNNVITAAAAAPVDPTKFIVPGAMNLLTQGINDQANINKASAQSTFANRGITGSSTEIQTLTRDIPNDANRALAEGTVKLLQGAYPLALEDKRATVDALYKTTSLAQNMRQLLGDENFKNMSLVQQRELANQDTKLKLTLADIELTYKAELANATLAIQAATSEQEKQLALQKFNYLMQERQKQRQQAFIGSLTSLAGAGFGFAHGGMEGAAIGAEIGKETGDAFGGIFTME